MYVDVIKGEGVFFAVIFLLGGSWYYVKALLQLRKLGIIMFAT